jgi:hypothetical protein
MAASARIKTFHKVRLMDKFHTWPGGASDRSMTIGSPHKNPGKPLHH